MQQQQIPIRLFDERTPGNSTIFVLGATGCGKTTLIANILLMRQRFIIIDVKEEYPAQFFGPDCKIVVSLGEFVSALNNGIAKIIIRVPSNIDDHAFVSAICLQLMDFQRANRKSKVTLVLDEFNRFVTPNGAPPGLYEIIQRGRSLNIEKIFAAQWFNNCPTWARDSFSEIYVYRHNEMRGLQTLETYGFNANDVSNLPAHCCIHQKSGELRQIQLTAKTK